MTTPAPPPAQPAPAQPAPVAAGPAAPIRFCPVCKVADDHPRHDIFGTDPNVAPHMDCCAKSGCPDGSCDVIVWIAASADDPKGPAGPHGDTPKGDNLRAFIVSKETQKVIFPLLDERDDATKHFTHADLDQSVHGSVTQSVVQLQPSNGGNA